MRILIDMDEVITDLQARVESIWNDLHPDKALFPKGERQSYYIGADQDPPGIESIWHILHGPGLFSSLDPVEGSLEAVDMMIGLGHEVFIVTSAGVSFPLAATEKYQWIKEHCGQHMLARLVITPAKFLVSGDILIDDRPELYRSDEASWEHILFNKTYNQDISEKRRLDWSNWQDILEL